MPTVQPRLSFHPHLAHSVESLQSISQVFHLCHYRYSNFQNVARKTVLDLGLYSYHYWWPLYNLLLATPTILSQFYQSYFGLLQLIIRFRINYFR